MVNRIVAEVSARPLVDLISLRNRGAVVTGAARGIGLAIASRLAEAGAGVLIADMDGAEADAAARRISQAVGGVCVGAKVDVADAGCIDALAARATRELGSLNIWVNNAGIYPITPVLEVSEAQWIQVVDVNLKGAFLGAQAAAKRMIAAGNPGVIINLSSIAGYRGNTTGATEYVAAKHGVRGLTKSLAAQLGRHGIRVLAIAPGTVETPGIARSREEVRRLGVSQLDAYQDKLLGRDGVPDDVARVALFCASDLSVFMTGSTLAVDGGMLALA